MLDEEGDEGVMEGIEEGRPSVGSGSTGVTGSAVDAELGGREKESTFETRKYSQQALRLTTTTFERN
jgi:hypothetical protein